MVSDDRRKEIREIFDHYDHDKNGTIDPREFGALLDALDQGFSEDEAKAGLEAIDLDKNGRIDFEEFMKWFGER